MVAPALALAAAFAWGQTTAARPEGEPAGHGSQRLAAEALRYAHANFSGDACLAAVDVVAARRLDPKSPPFDQFSFTMRSAALHKMTFVVRVCFPGPGAADARCNAEWEFEQLRQEAPPRCLAPKAGDSGEALTVAAKSGLPKPAVDGMRLALRSVAKAGKGLARNAKMKGKNVWIVESRDSCLAIDAQSLQLYFKGSCPALGWQE